MKQRTWKLVLPLTVISFVTFTKWWYVLPVDAPDTMMAGFPLVCLSDGWHTSMSLQIFVAEFFFDLMVYFLFWFGLLFLIDRYWIKLKVPNMLTIPLLGLAGLIITLAIIVASMPEHIFKVRRDFDMEVMVTGYKFIWQHQERPDFAQYDPREKIERKR